MHLTRTSMCTSGWNWEVHNFNQALVIRAVGKGHQGGGQHIFKKEVGTSGRRDVRGRVPLLDPQSKTGWEYRSVSVK